MATNKIHFLAFLLWPHVYARVIGDSRGRADYYFQPQKAAVVISNDSVRCWSKAREFTHFTVNPITGEVSWCQFPLLPVKHWTKEDVENMPKMSYGKPGVAIVDESTIPEVLWKHNERTFQNELFFIHLIQDRAYDRFVRSIIDTSRRYEDVYVFEGKELTGAQVRGEGIERWTKGILSELDGQFFVRLAKQFFRYTRTKADRGWIESVMIPAIRQAYSADLAEATVKFVSLSDKVNELIAEERFDEECWPVPNAVVDQWVEWMLEDMYDALKELNVL